MGVTDVTDIRLLLFFSFFFLAVQNIEYFYRPFRLILQNHGIELQGSKVIFFITA
jgi:hypothetical protein